MAATTGTGQAGAQTDRKTGAEMAADADTARGGSGRQRAVSPASSSLAVLRAETRLYLREPGAIFWVLLAPTVLLALLGAIPTFREANDDLDGLRVIDLYVPIVILMSLAFMGAQVMPGVLSGYRERGILRRMFTTPVRPTSLLMSQIVVNGLVCVVAAALALAVGRMAFQVELPAHAGGYALVFLLMLAAALALGAMISAVAPSTKAVGVVGPSVVFPMLFCSGVYLPVAAMPDVLQQIVGGTPFGAAAQALDQAAAGQWPDLLHLVVIALWAVLLGGAAVRWFRWQ